MAGVGYRAESDQVMYSAEREIILCATDNFGVEHRIGFLIPADDTFETVRTAAHRDMRPDIRDVRYHTLGDALPTLKTVRNNSQLLKYALRLREAEAELEQTLSTANDPYYVTQHNDDTDE